MLFNLSFGTTIANSTAPILPPPLPPVEAPPAAAAAKNGDYHHELDGQRLDFSLFNWTWRLFSLFILTFSSGRSKQHAPA